MKKKILSCFMAMVLGASPMLTYAQLGGVTAGADLDIGDTFTYNGQTFIIVNPPDPNTTDPSQETAEATAAFALFLNGNTVKGNTSFFTGGVAPVGFTAAPQVQLAPFDLGIASVLGVGALAAYKRGRRRQNAVVPA